MNKTDELLEKAKTAKTFEEQCDYIVEFLDIHTQEIATLLENKMDKAKTEEERVQIQNEYKKLVIPRLQNKEYLN